LKTQLEVRMPSAGIEPYEDLLEKLDLELLADPTNEELARKRIDLLEKTNEHRWLRITVHEMSYMDRAHALVLMRENEQWFEQKTGLTVYEDMEKGSEVDQLRQLMFRRALMLACVPRTSNYRDGVTTYHCEDAMLPSGATPNEEMVWKPADLPAEWIPVEGIAYVMPSWILAAWHETAYYLNAGLLPWSTDFLAGNRARFKRVRG